MIQLRKATPSDVDHIIALIHELASYEKAAHEVTITREALLQDGFGKNPLYWVILAIKDEEIIGMSFYYIRYSTWKGKCLYLEDLIVKEPYRHTGIGSLLMNATIEEAKKMNAAMIVWQVLHWNTPAIKFYEKYQAEFDKEWVTCKIRKEQYDTLLNKQK